MKGEKGPMTNFYMNMPVKLKSRLRTIANNGKPRRTMTGLIVHVMSLYAAHIIDPIEGLDDYMNQIAARTEGFSMEEMLEEATK